MDKIIIITNIIYIFLILFAVAYTGLLGLQWYWKIKTKNFSVSINQDNFVHLALYIAILLGLFS